MSEISKGSVGFRLMWAKVIQGDWECVVGDASLGLWNITLSLKSEVIFLQTTFPFVNRPWKKWLRWTLSRALIQYKRLLLDCVNPAGTTWAAAVMWRSVKENKALSINFIVGYLFPLQPDQTLTSPSLLRLAGTWLEFFFFPGWAFDNETAHLLMGLSQITRLKRLFTQTGLKAILLPAGFHHLCWSDGRGERAAPQV